MRMRMSRLKESTLDTQTTTLTTAQSVGGIPGANSSKSQKLKLKKPLGSKIWVSLELVINLSAVDHALLKARRNCGEK